MCKIINIRCIAASTLETWDSDSTWYSALDGTRWLHIVGDCLQVAFRVADRLLEANESVIIKGNTEICFVTLQLYILQHD